MIIRPKAVLFLLRRKSNKALLIIQVGTSKLDAYAKVTIVGRERITAENIFEKNFLRFSAIFS